MRSARRWLPTGRRRVPGAPTPASRPAISTTTSPSSTSSAPSPLGTVALAWLLARGPEVVPIPGTKQIRYLDQNLAALDLHLTAADLDRLDTALPAGAAAGGHYPDAVLPQLGT